MNIYKYSEAYKQHTKPAP